MRYLLLLLLLVTPCYAQEFKVNTDLMEIGGLTEVSIVEGKVYSKTPPTSATPVGTISIEPKGSIVFLNYAVDTETKQFVNLKAERTETTLKWTWTQPGKLKVKFTVIDLAKGTGGDQEFDVELKGTKPKPDDPKPDPKPEPIVEKLDNLSVLFIFETGLAGTYPAETRQILQSSDLKIWLQQNLPEPGGLSRARWLDKDTKFSQCTTVFCKWLSTPPQEIPGMVIGNENKIVYSGKLLPIEETKKLILQYKK